MASDVATIERPAADAPVPLTERVYLKRRSVILAKLRAAEAAKRTAALAAATGAGSDADQRAAFAEVEMFQQQLGLLDSAWNEQLRLDAQAQRDAEVRRWEGTVAEADAIAESMEALASGLEPVHVRVQDIIATYAEGLIAMKDLCRRHRLDVSGMLPGDGRGEALRRLNTSQGPKEARQALVGLSKLDELLRSLRTEARSALDVLRPGAFRRGAE